MLRAPFASATTDLSWSSASSSYGGHHDVRPPPASSAASSPATAALNQPRHASLQPSSSSGAAAAPGASANRTSTNSASEESPCLSSPSSSHAIRTGKGARQNSKSRDFWAHLTPQEFRWGWAPLRQLGAFATVAHTLPGGPVLVPSEKRFRFWIDYQLFNGTSSAALIEKALVEVGGVKTGGPPKVNPATGLVEKSRDYGYMHLDAWDLIWTITSKAMLAAEVLRPGQMVPIIPGFLCISRKTSLVKSLRSVYGDELAFSIVPKTFKLPEEMDEWAECMQKEWEGGVKEDGGGGGGRESLWMLKNNHQRGTGLKLVRAGKEALDSIFETCSRPGFEGLTLYRWYLAQRYVMDPLLIGGCKSGVRVWVLVPDAPKPFRVYLHSKGLVLFSSFKYDVGNTGPSRNGKGLPLGHITNYAQNQDGQVWSMDRFRSHLGEERFARMWKEIERSVALTFVAALPRVAEVQREMALPPRSSFQFFGLDFLIDASLNPWLLECNATPSMKVDHADPETERMIYNQKWPVIRDMVRMLGICPQRFNPNAKDPTDLGFMEAELQARGGFQPLMHLFPASSEEAIRNYHHRADQGSRNNRALHGGSASGGGGNGGRGQQGSRRDADIATLGRDSSSLWMEEQEEEVGGGKRSTGPAGPSSGDGGGGGAALREIPWTDLDRLMRIFAREGSLQRAR